MKQLLLSAAITIASLAAFAEPEHWKQLRNGG